MQQSFPHAIMCITEQMNFKSLLDSIKKGKQNGQLDVVIYNNCAQRYKATQCAIDFTEEIEPCLNEEEKERKDFFINLTKSSFDTVCMDDGKRIERELQ